MEDSIFTLVRALGDHQASLFGNDWRACLLAQIFGKVHGLDQTVALRRASTFPLIIVHNWWGVLMQSARLVHACVDEIGGGAAIFIFAFNSPILLSIGFGGFSSELMLQNNSQI